MSTVVVSVNELRVEVETVEQHLADGQLGGVRTDRELAAGDLHQPDTLVGLLDLVGQPVVGELEAGHAGEIDIVAQHTDRVSSST